MKKIDNTTVSDIQLIGTLLSILSFSFAFILLYNQKLLEENKKPLQKVIKTQAGNNSIPIAGKYRYRQTLLPMQ